MTHVSTVLTFDEVLTQYVGEFGRGQKLIVFLVSLLAVPNGLISLLWVMMTIDPIKNRHWHCVDPSNMACNAVYASPSSQALCDLPTASWQWTNTDSLVSRFNLICSNNWKIQFTNSLYFIGCFLGSGIFGALSDRIGRKRPMFLAIAILAAATLVNAAAPNYWFVAVMRLVAGMGGAGQVQGILLLAMETTGRSARGVAAGLEVVMFCIGEGLLVALSVAAPNWRSLTLAAGTICALGLLLYPLVPESARWLMSQQGKEEQALKVLRSLSIRNGSRMPEQRSLPYHNSCQVLCENSSVCDHTGDLEQQQQQQQDEKEEEELSKGMPILHIGINRTGRSGDSAQGGYFAADLMQDVNPNKQFSKSGSGNDALCDFRNSSDNSITAAAAAINGKSLLAASAKQHTKHKTPVGCRTVPNNPSAAGTARTAVAAGAVDDRNSPAAAAAAAAAPVGLLQLLRQPALAAMSAVMVLTWFANFHTFYVIALGSGGLPGSIHVTFAANVSGQLVATVLAGVLVDKLGRHNIISCSLLLGGVACLACAHATDTTAQIVLATIGQFGCTASLAVAPTYTAELYPTAVRSTALGICNKACRLGCLSAPFMVLLGASSGVGTAIFLPYVGCGSVCLAAGLLVLFMPETLGKDMPEKMEDLQQLQTVFTAKPWRHGGCLATMRFLFRPRATSTLQTTPSDGPRGTGRNKSDLESQLHRAQGGSVGERTVRLQLGGSETAAPKAVDHG